MERSRSAVIRTKGGFVPRDRVDGPVKPPPRPADAERSALPPAYWKDRTKKGGDG